MLYRGMRVDIDPFLQKASHNCQLTELMVGTTTQLDRLVDHYSSVYIHPPSQRQPCIFFLI